MDVPHEAILLRIFTSADDRYGVEEPLYRAIVMNARELHLAGRRSCKDPSATDTPAGFISLISSPPMSVRS